jgi:tRNA (cytidine56-2'-O)-methyltransferase
MNKAFGGNTQIVFEKRKPVVLLKELQKQGFNVIHLTMYGLPLDEQLSELKTKEKIAIVVGSEKVPREVYNQADYNIAVGNQPHSEVAALGITLYALHDGSFPTLKQGKKVIVPQAKGKRVVNPNI